MLKIAATFITPDEQTYFLVGPEGLVWTQPAIGEAFIMAARNESARATAALFVAELFKMNLVPYGMPVNQRVIVAMFGGEVLRDCQWVQHTHAPLPTGDAGDTLPTRAAVIQ